VDDGVEEDARKLSYRNWLADTQGRGRWRHLREEAKVHQGCRNDYDGGGDDDDDDDNNNNNNEDDEGYEDVDWTPLAQSSVEWWPLVTVAIHVAVP
jgi:hypothetical protein